MKKLIIPFLFLLASLVASGAGTDTTIQRLRDELDQQKKEIQRIGRLGDSNARSIEKINTARGEEKFPAWTGYIFLLPLLLSAGLFLYFKRGGRLKSAIGESITEKSAAPRTVTLERYQAPVVTAAVVAEPNPPGQAPQANPLPPSIPVPPTSTTSTTTELQKSASRLILFFSGLTSIVLAISFATVFLYGYVRGVQTPDYSALVNVLLALGIGVVPYSVNQLSGKSTNS